MDEARQGERAGASESIEPARGTTKPFSKQRGRFEYVPAGNRIRI